MAQVEPLPLVPATMITGQSNLQPHRLLDRAHAVEAHVDVDFGVARLEQGQPVGQGGGERLHGIDFR